MYMNKQQAGSEHPEDSVGSEIRSIRESIGSGAGDPLFATTERSLKRWIAPEFEEQMHEREGYAGKWPNNAMYPQYGCLRMAKLRRALGHFRLEDAEVVGDLCELTNMCDIAQLGCQHATHPRRWCILGRSREVKTTLEAVEERRSISSRANGSFCQWNGHAGDIRIPRIRPYGRGWPRRIFLDEGGEAEWIEECKD